VNPTGNARRLRRDQTDEEKQLWRSLRSRRFAGFKFRRQHPVGGYDLDFYCAQAKLATELDGFQHGLPDQMTHDREREVFLAQQDIMVLRFWNHQWRKNPDGCLIDIWNALQERTGCLRVMKETDGQRFIPPESGAVQPKRK
jgi:very-short-patch-repair endonuclease